MVVVVVLSTSDCPLAKVRASPDTNHNFFPMSVQVIIYHTVAYSVKHCGVDKMKAANFCTHLRTCVNEACQSTVAY